LGEALGGAAQADAVGECRGGGLGDDADDIEACEAAGDAGGLSLGIVKVSWDGDDGAVDGLAEAALGGLLKLT